MNYAFVIFFLVNVYVVYRFRILLFTMFRKKNYFPTVNLLSGEHDTMYHNNVCFHLALLSLCISTKSADSTVTIITNDFDPQIKKNKTKTKSKSKSKSRQENKKKRSSSQQQKKEMCHPFLKTKYVWLFFLVNNRFSNY